jgi:predicted lipase
VAYTRIRHVEVNVVGHSLGGVVAELAGLDIEEYLHRNTTNYEVNVVAFNPPRLGNQKLVDEYRSRLKARPRQFRISVFTREGDIVDDLPVNFSLGIISRSYRQVRAAHERHAHPKDQCTL